MSISLNSRPIDGFNACLGLIQSFSGDPSNAAVSRAWEQASHEMYPASANWA